MLDKRGIMKEDIRSAIVALTGHAKKVISGSYDNVGQIFSLSDETKHTPEVANLAETFGMMVVKVEAREFALEQTIEKLIEEKQKVEMLIKLRSQLSVIFISTVLLTTFYIFVLGFLESKLICNLPNINQIREYSSRVVEFITLGIVIIFIRLMRLPLKEFGVTLVGWKRSALESVAVSIVVIIMLAFFKYFMIQSGSTLFQESAIFNFGYFGISYITYLLVAPMQEFIARGTMQGSLSLLLPGKNSGWLAVLVTSFLFGALHMSHSIALSISALITSLLWGWMYERHKTLVGVSLSHFLVGNAAGLMGYWTFF